MNDEVKKALGLVYSEEDIVIGLQNLENKQHELEEGLLGHRKITYKDVLCSKKYNKMLRCGIILCSIQQLSGINAIIFYSNNIFKDLQATELMSRVLTLIMGFIMFGSNALSIPLLRLFGRKTLMVSGEILIAIDLTILGYVSNLSGLSPEFKSVFVMIFLIVFSYSFGATLWLYVGEILNDKVLTLSAGINLFLTCVISYVFPVALKALNDDLTYIFYFFALQMLLGAIYSYFDLIESRGLNKSEAINLITS